MNCHDFQERLNDCLDRRVSPRSDGPLKDHAGRCPECGARLDAWRNVESLLKAAPAGTDLAPSASSYRHVTRVLVSMAAVVLLMFVVTSDRSPLSRLDLDPSNRVSRWDSLAERSSRSGSARSHFRADDRQHEVSWWKGIQGSDWVDRDWIQQNWVNRTMPTVRSMQEGVAPLGRTLMRAVTILTLGGRDQTS